MLFRANPPYQHPRGCFWEILGVPGVLQGTFTVATAGKCKTAVWGLNHERLLAVHEGLSAVYHLLHSPQLLNVNFTIE
jgi:hypothetical protein